MKKIGLLIILTSIILFVVTFAKLKSESLALKSLYLLALGIAVFFIGAVKEQAREITLLSLIYKIFFWIRKILGLTILADLLWTVTKPEGPPFLFLWLMFFNVAIIFCLVLLLTKRNNIFVGIMLLLVGLFYSLVPVFPGPTLGMMNISSLMVKSEFQLLFIWIFIAKWLVLISSILMLISGFFRPPKKISSKA